jgi:hypothetical protein
MSCDFNRLVKAPWSNPGIPRKDVLDNRKSFLSLSRECNMYLKTDAIASMVFPEKQGAAKALSRRVPGGVGPGWLAATSLRALKDRGETVHRQA